MSLVESRGQITKALRDLLTRWEHVRSEWNDAQAENFQRQYILELETQVRKATAAMDHLNIVLQKITKDCE